MLEIVLRLITLPPAPSKALDGLLRSEDRAQHIGVELAMKILFGHRLERREAEHASVVDEDAGRAELRLGLGEQTLARRRVWRHSPGWRPPCRPSFEISPTTRSASALLEAIIDGDRRPRLGEARAIAAPMPFEAPVTIATFPLSSPMVLPP